MNLKNDTIESINPDRPIPSEEVLLEAARLIFDADSGLSLVDGEWYFIILKDRNISVVRFALSDGKSIVFSRVRLAGWFAGTDSCKLNIEISINGLSPMRREFYVAEECFSGV